MALTLDKTRVTPLSGAIVRTVRLGEDASGGAGMYPGASSTYMKADADANGKHRPVCVLITDNQGSYNTSGDYASGDDVSACFFGPVAGFTGMDPTLPVYIDTTAGVLTQTIPATGTPCVIGYPISDDILFVAPQQPNGGYNYT